MTSFEIQYALFEDLNEFISHLDLITACVEICIRRQVIGENVGGRDES